VVKLVRVLTAEHAAQRPRGRRVFYECPVCWSLRAYRYAVFQGGHFYRCDRCGWKMPFAARRSKRDRALASVFIKLNQGRGL
jgi:predicted RNA-binding Zn-ribbon protein involved in translation (DUF1610 family)